MKDKFKKYLPLGSVVLMKEAKKRIMVTGYAVKSPQYEGKIFDYIGCLYPEGMISQDKNLLFNHEDIAQIFAIGYTDDEQKAFMKKLDEIVATMEKDMNSSSSSSNSVE